MASHTTYRCDRCGKNVEGSAQLHTILLVQFDERNAREIGHYSFSLTYRDSRAHLEVCGGCREELGIGKVLHKGEKPEQPPTPTTEEALADVIRTLIRQELEQ